MSDVSSLGILSFRRACVIGCSANLLSKRDEDFLRDREREKTRRSPTNSGNGHKMSDLMTNVRNYDNL